MNINNIIDLFDIIILNNINNIIDLLNITININNLLT